jgi:hypothetical protein
MDLMVTLFNIALVDTQLIYPDVLSETSLLVEAEEIVEIFAYLEASAVDSNV